MVVCPQVRAYSNAPGKPQGFFGKLVDNLRQELSKDKELKENIAKFREDAQKLEQSEALKQARKKFESIEAEASKGSEVLKEQFGKLGETLKESEFARKAGKFVFL